MTSTSIALVVLTVAVAAAIDLRARRIPNWLTAGAALAGLVAAGAAIGPRGLLASAAGLGLGLLAFLPLYVVRGLGAGDVKLFAAVGALVGPRDLFSVFVATALAGALMAAGTLVARGGLRVAGWNVARIASSLGAGQLPPRDVTLDSPAAVRLPYGVAIAAGTVAALVGRHMVHVWFV